jgi:hypothetical protein
MELTAKKEKAMRKFDDTKGRKKLNQEGEFTRREEDEGGQGKWGWGAGGVGWSGVGVSDTLVTLSG